ncbi:MAG TPA: hypothetical protein VEK33_11420 [Terriglobales bacterium]|nr:hypothetical protein [Terriglobales bacterium]
MPDATTVVAKNAFAAFGTDQQLQGPLNDLPLAFQARESSRLAHQTFINVDVSPHCMDHTPFSDIFVHLVELERDTAQTHTSHLNLSPRFMMGLEALIHAGFSMTETLWRSTPSG